MPGRSCGICRHPQAMEISRALAERCSRRDVSERFTVSDAALQRHRSRCLKIRFFEKPGKTAKTPASWSENPSARGSVRFVESGTDFGPVGDVSPCCEHCNLRGNDPAKALTIRAERLITAAEAILLRAAAAGDDRLALQAIREAKSAVELSMKAAGLLAGDAPVQDNRKVINYFEGMKVEEIRAILKALAKPEEPAAIDAESRAVEPVSIGPVL